VERRQASASRWTRGRIRSMRLMEVRLPAFRFPFYFFVIASQRVRPEVAGPMAGSAKQSSVAVPLWIASSLRSSQ